MLYVLQQRIHIARTGQGFGSMQRHLVCEGCGKKKRRGQPEIDRDSGEQIRETFERWPFKPFCGFGLNARHYVKACHFS
jgi:hypothetical protein